MDRLHFLHPVRLGEVVIVQAQVNYVGRTSMEVGVRVFAENPSVPSRRQTTRAYLTFVAVDEQGRPREVPPLTLRRPSIAAGSPPRAPAAPCACASCAL